jgi:lysozyme family protein
MDDANRAQLRNVLEAAQVDTENRLRGAVDPQERQALAHTLAQLNTALNRLNQADLLMAAADAASAADALDNALAASKPPFDVFVERMLRHARELTSAISALQGIDRLPPAAAPTATPPAQPTPAPSAAAAASSAAAPAALPRASGLPTPINSRKFEDLEAEYVAFFDSCIVDPARQSNVDFYVGRLKQHRQTYATLGEELGIPWYFIGIVHGMEGGFDFSKHLHNGDPLSARTRQVPAGRPPTGNPPFTWIESARDALKLKKLDQIGASNWTVARVLYTLEGYNGFGYRKIGIPSPYLWSFSNLYVKGKFVADGKFDPEAVSKQCGAAVVLRELQESNLLGA